MSEKVIVFKDRESREIHTYVDADGHGARMDVQAFISLVADFYGSPVTTLTRSGHLEGLRLAAEQAIRHMKAQTKEVAAVNVEPS